MKYIISFLTAALLFVSFASNVWAQARVMNPGEAVGQLVFLSADDLRNETEKYKSLNPLSIPVFEELPMQLSVVAGTITLAQQNLLSHVQIKATARKTPNLDISKLEGGMNNEFFADFGDGDWVRMLLGSDGSIILEPSDEAAANAFYKSKVFEPIRLVADLQANRIFKTSELSWTDFDKVGSKAANYAELAKALNTPERTVVKPGYAIPFFYYQQFLDMNPAISDKINSVTRDPLMKYLARTSYREQKLREIRDLITGSDDVEPQNLISQELLDNIISVFDQERDADGLPRRMKLRSSTNAEDLANFNGAGLYESESYKPEKDGEEKSKKKKMKSLSEALRTVWSSVWTLRAFEERAYFQINHLDVKMAIQVNPSFRTEKVDGVVITKNVANEPSLLGKAVYIEAQRGDEYSVANPDPGIRPERILVQVDPANPLDQSTYVITVLQKSNIGDDMLTILSEDNPNPIMRDEEIKDLAYQSLKAERHFKPLLGADDDDFALDLEFKVDDDTGMRQVYLKQARPYID